MANYQLPGNRANNFTGEVFSGLCDLSSSSMTESLRQQVERVPHRIEYMRPDGHRYVIITLLDSQARRRMHGALLEKAQAAELNDRDDNNRLYSWYDLAVIAKRVRETEPLLDAATKYLALLKKLGVPTPP